DGEADPGALSGEGGAGLAGDDDRGNADVLEPGERQRRQRRLVGHLALVVGLGQIDEHDPGGALLAGEERLVVKVAVAALVLRFGERLAGGNEAADDRDLALDPLARVIVAAEL